MPWRFAQGKGRSLWAAVAPLLLAGCAVYTFSGSTLPGYLKTVDVPLFVNETLQPGVAEDLTSELNRQVLSGNLLRVVSANGDATISGTVKSYTNDEYYYDVKKPRQADVTDYIVRLVVEVEFLDNRKNSALYKGTITGQGIYKYATQKEEDGRKLAIRDVVEQIMQNSIQSW